MDSTLPSPLQEFKKYGFNKRTRRVLAVKCKLRVCEISFHGNDCANAAVLYGKLQESEYRRKTFSRNPVYGMRKYLHLVAYLRFSFLYLLRYFSFEPLRQR